MYKLKKSLDINLPKETIKRIKSYFLSDLYKISFSKTKHWQKRKELNKNVFSFKENCININMNMESGFADHYPNLFPKLIKNQLNEKDFFAQRLKLLDPENFKDLTYLNNFKILKFLIKRFVLRKLGHYYGEGYDPLFYFDQYWKNKKVPISSKQIIKEYSNEVSNFIMKAYFVYNSLNEKIGSNFSKINSIVEIGPGSGTLAKIIKNYYNKTKYIFVDLPEIIPYPLINLTYSFPDSSFILPNEINENIDLQDFDFVFLLPNQTKFIKKNSIDLGINITSFQEMDTTDIEIYFELLRKILKRDNFFYCLNAVDKIMEVEGVRKPIRFFEYPWKSNDKDISYELSSIHKHLTTNPFYERITKLEIY